MNTETGNTGTGNPGTGSVEPGPADPGSARSPNVHSANGGGPAAADLTRPGSTEFTRLDNRMKGIAYRMLGSWAEAEDVAADSWLRWHQHHDRVDNAQAWLTTVATRISLDHWRTNRRRRESYIGPWLPEPIDPGLLPEETAEQRQSLALGLMLIMERLTPDERAVYVLRHAFDHTFVEIGAMLGRTTDSARQLGHRATRKVAGASPRPRDRSELQQLRTLITAIIEGRQAEAVSLLTGDAVLLSDGGGKVTAARRPVLGAEKIIRFLHGVSHRDQVDLSLVEINNGWAVQMLTGGNRWMIALETGTDGVHSLYSVGNPDKLGHLPARGIPLSPGGTG